MWSCSQLSSFIFLESRNKKNLKHQRKVSEPVEEDSDDDDEDIEVKRSGDVPWGKGRKKKTSILSSSG